MTISPLFTLDGIGSPTLNVTSLNISRPNPPLSTYYTDLASDQILINVALDTFYEDNKDKIIFSAIGASGAASFKYRIVPQSQNFSSVNDTLTTNATFTVSGLSPGTIYKIQIRGYEFANGTGNFGNLLIVENILLSSTARSLNVTTTQQYIDAFLRVAENNKENTNQYFKNASDWNNRESDQAKTPAVEIIQPPSNIESHAAARRYDNLFLKNVNKSMLNLYNLSKDPNIYTVAYKTFHEIPLSIDIYSPSYYSFGSTILLDSSAESTGESGGIGFFVSESGTNGYFLQIDSTKRSGDINSKRRIRLFKVINGNKNFMQDTQSIPETTTDIINPGVPYKVDIKVKYAQDGSYADIIIYINGFKISAKDTSPIYPSNTVALFSSIGNIFFDYLYGFKITESDYNSDYLYNAYSAQFSKNSLKFVLGDKIFNKNSKVEGNWTQNGRLEDFGKVARELKKIEADFESPSIPIAPSAGINDNVYIVGHKSDNFKSEIYVLNNSGFFTPLSDGNVSLIVYGYSIYNSGSHEYEEGQKNLYTKDEAAYFESTWIQNEKDAKELSSWLKNQWSKGYVIIEASVFGGALLSVGDIITINYPYHGLSTSQKFLIQSVNQSFSDGGMGTSITCRSL